MIEGLPAKAFHDMLKACQEALMVVDECYEATGHVKVCVTSEQRLRLVAAITQAKENWPT